MKFKILLRPSVDRGGGVRGMTDGPLQRAVRILLECILVIYIFTARSSQSRLSAIVAAHRAGEGSHVIGT